MSILIALFIGAIIGSIGGYFLHENIDSIVVNMVFGIAGSLLGLVLYFLATTDVDSLVSLPSVLCSIIGALTFVLIFGMLQRAVPKRTAHQTNVQDHDIDED